MPHDNAETSTTQSTRGVLRLVVIVALVAAIVLVAADNRDKVSVGYVIGDVEAPLWIVLVAAGIAGIVIGWLIRHRPGRN
jgi:uncharacterized integral membrane protein